MERIYKVYKPTSGNGKFALCVNATIKTLPFYVWRDLSRQAYHSMDLGLGINSNHDGFGVYDFATKESLDKAVAVLNGALFKEVTADEWENWKSGIDKEQLGLIIKMSKFDEPKILEIPHPTNRVWPGTPNCLMPSIEVDSWQVGYNRAGKLVAYDYGH